MRDPNTYRHPGEPPGGADPTDAVDRRGRRGLTELAIVAAAFIAYSALRIAVEGSTSEAESNALKVIDAERAIGIDWERRAQSWVLSRPHWMSFWNLVYQWMYWSTVGIALLVLWRRSRHDYRILRDTLIISAALGLVIFMLWPVSPPRFLDGYVDTIRIHGAGLADRPAALTNQYAAVPSFHVAWPAAAGIVVASGSERPIVRLLVMTPAMLLAPAVVFTGNHFVFDVVAGLVVVGVAHRVVGQLPPRRPGRSIRRTRRLDRRAPTITTPVSSAMSARIGIGARRRTRLQDGGRATRSTGRGRPLAGVRHHLVADDRSDGE